MKLALTILLFVALLAILLVIPSPLPGRIGLIDFEAYWSASDLLRQGKNFADPQLMLQVEKSFTPWSESFPMMTWNPPWLLVLLIPLTVVSFSRAVWWWMLANISMIFASAFFLWYATTQRPSTHRRAWVMIGVAFAFSATLMALVAGQVNTLVLLGLAGYLFFSERKQDGRAGIFFSLTMVKPHLVYITAALVLLQWWTSKSWRALIGFTGVLAGLTMIVLVLRPTFLFEYGATVGVGGLFDFQSPTLSNVLALLIGWNGFKWIFVIVLPVAVWVWWRTRAQWNWRTLIDSSLLLSIITMPFGWSYDYIVLLVPVSRIVARIVEDHTPKHQAWILISVLVTADLAMFWVRLNADSEIYFFWLPIVVALIYAYTFAVGKHWDAVDA